MIVLFLENYILRGSTRNLYNIIFALTEDNSPFLTTNKLFSARTHDIFQIRIRVVPGSDFKLKGRRLWKYFFLLRTVVGVSDRSRINWLYLATISHQ